MAEPFETIQARYDEAEHAFNLAQAKLDSGGLIGSLIGKYQRWVAEGEMAQANEEYEIAEYLHHNQASV